jgi:TonB family protein
MKTRIFSSLLAVLLLNLCISKTNAQDNKVYDHVSLKTPPTYPGGIQSFYNWLGNNMKYPAMASENNIQGTVYVTFTIEKDGSLTDIKIEGRKLGYGTDEEAVRVLKLSKPWNPGVLDDKPVRVKYNIPIKFAMPNRPKAAVESNTVYSHVSMENPPTYPGGIAQLYKFLGDNIVYPKAAAEAKVQGTVYISFTIEKDGSLTDIKSEARQLGAGTEEEAVRVLKLSKKWNPGMQNGQPVRVKYNIPVKFTMKK